MEQARSKTRRHKPSSEYSPVEPENPFAIEDFAKAQNKPLLPVASPVATAISTGYQSSDPLLPRV